MRDLRGNLVFPRLAYAAISQAMDRNARRLFRLMISRPRNRAVQFGITLRDHQDLAELVLAAFAAIAAWTRAFAFFLGALGFLFLAISRF
jgi:hypothetical protein